MPNLAGKGIKFKKKKLNYAPFNQSNETVCFSRVNSKIKIIANQKSPKQKRIAQTLALKVS
jgi:hypothetical protein